jgi:hypothetical protein
MRENSPCSVLMPAKKKRGGHYKTHYSVVGGCSSTTSAHYAIDNIKTIHYLYIIY